MSVKTVRRLLISTLVALCVSGSEQVPAFEDYAVRTESRGPATPVKLTTRSERMFRARLSEAAKQPPDFAGHYKFAVWGCGSMCAAGAIIDLTSGRVYPPPLAGAGQGWDRWISCPGMFEGTGYEYRVESRLMIVRCGSNFDKKGRNRPDVYYLLWTDTMFKTLLHVRHNVASHE